jgi:acetylornithine deacetylase
VAEPGVGEVRELLSELVRIPSVNPRDGNGAGEGDMGEFVAGWLQEAGLEVGIQEVLPGRYNVVARLPGRDSRRALLLEGHLDTVEVEGMTVTPFTADVRGGRLYGRGAADGKGPLAAFMLALRELSRAGPEPPLDVVLAAVVDEEYLGRGIVRFMESWDSERRIAGAVVGAPTQMRLVLGHKGLLRFRVQALGRMAHSAQPWEGDNAIQRMAEVLNFVRDHLAPELSRVTHPLMGQPTLVPTLIEGGVGVNLIPHECSIMLDRRTVPGEDAMQVWSRYKVALEALAPGKIEVQRPLAMADAMSTPIGAGVVSALASSLAARGLEAKPVGVNFGSDAGKIGRHGVACILFGPGSNSESHQPNESIEMHQVATAVSVVMDLAGRFSV